MITRAELEAKAAELCNIDGYIALPFKDQVNSVATFALETAIAALNATCCCCEECANKNDALIAHLRKELAVNQESKP